MSKKVPASSDQLELRRLDGVIKTLENTMKNITLSHDALIKELSKQLVKAENEHSELLEKMK